MKRQILGKIHGTDDNPIANGVVVFARSLGSYTPTTQYPPDNHVCVTDGNGNLVNCFLWVNEVGDLISDYTAKVNGRDIFTFSIPVGDGSPIELSELRSGSQPVESYPQSILDYIDKKFESIIGNDSEPLYLKINFSQANLTNGIYTFDQSLGAFPFVVVRNNLGQVVYPPIEYESSSDVIRINLSDFAPIAGNWVLLLGKNFDNPLEFTVNQNDLINGEYTITHNLARSPFIQIQNGAGEWIFPNSIQEVSPTQVKVNLESFQPISNLKILVT